MLLSGGSVKLTGLLEYLQEQLGIPVQVVDLFNNGLIHLPGDAGELQQQMPLLATAYGLALREPVLAREKGGLR